MIDTSTSKCLVDQLIEAVKGGTKTLDKAFELLTTQAKSSQIFVAAYSMGFACPDDEVGVYAATFEFADAVRLLADAMINGHEHGLASWEARYANLQDKTTSPPKEGERLIIEEWEELLPPIKIYLRQGRLEEVLFLAKQRLADQQMTSHRHLRR